jgi:hypothetical protein
MTLKAESVPKDVRGWLVKSACGRQWFVSWSTVWKDYMEFLKDYDGLTRKEARAKANENLDFIETWFYEQFNWDDVERLGVLVTVPTEKQIKAALDFYRSYASNAISPKRINSKVKAERQ